MILNNNKLYDGIALFNLITNHIEYYKKMYYFYLMIGVIVIDKHLFLLLITHFCTIILSALLCDYERQINYVHDNVVVKFENDSLKAEYLPRSICYFTDTKENYMQRIGRAKVQQRFFET